MSSQSKSVFIFGPCVILQNSWEGQTIMVVWSDYYKVFPSLIHRAASATFTWNF